MNNELPNIELWCHEGTSDKLYRVAIEQSSDGYVVNVAYGRRGSALNTGTKTRIPVAYDEALSCYTRLVKAKLAKGYKPLGRLAGTEAEGGTVGEVIVEADQVDTGLRPQLLNPISEEEAEAYLANADWCVQEKFDGRRLLVRKQGDTVIAANRKGRRVSLPLGVHADLIGLPGDFVLDGERVGETYHVFDLLETNGQDWRDRPYSARLGALQRRVGGLGGSVLTAPTATNRNKRSLFAYLRQAGKEGAVFKNLHATWSEGRPSKGGSQLKCKFWATCSCIVSGINARRSIEVAMDGRSMGNVTIPPHVGLPSVGQVVEIRYLYVTGRDGSLYQPIYLGVREDVDASECTRRRQLIKYKPAASAAA